MNATNKPRFTTRERIKVSQTWVVRERDEEERKRSGAKRDYKQGGKVAFTVPGLRASRASPMP
jgi:hypothetical protein